MAELRRQIEYKGAWAGVHLHFADRWYPSSKTCSGCGAVKAKPRLSERVFSCLQCGLVLDRDLNAARNLAVLVSSHSWWATENEPDGNPCKTGVAPATGTATGRPGRQALVNAVAARRRLPVYGGPTTTNNQGNGSKK